jgi:hypothetical protein
MNDTITPPVNVKVGDLFCMSWGYDQTNVNHFQVTRITPKGVYVREIGCRSVPGSGGFMSDTVKPTKDSFLNRSQWCGGYSSTNPETFRRLKWSSYSKSWYFGFEGRYFAYQVTENSEHYRSWYA